MCLTTCDRFPSGVSGELCIGGAGVTWLPPRPDLTAQKVCPRSLQGRRLGACIRAATLARFADGTIEFLGRLKNQIKLRGYRIELGEVESELFITLTFIAAPLWCAKICREISASVPIRVSSLRSFRRAHEPCASTWIAAPEYMLQPASFVFFFPTCRSWSTAKSTRKLLVPSSQGDRGMSRRERTGAEPPPPRSCTSIAVGRK